MKRRLLADHPMVISAHELVNNQQIIPFILCLPGHILKQMCIGMACLLLLFLCHIPEKTEFFRAAAVIDSQLLQHLHLAGASVLHTLAEQHLQPVPGSAHGKPHRRGGLSFPVSAVDMQTSLFYMTHNMTPFTVRNTRSARTAVPYSSRPARLMSSYSTGRSASPSVGFSYSFPK